MIKLIKWGGSGDISEDGLNFKKTQSNVYGGAFTSKPLSSGKWYLELKVISSSRPSDNAFCVGINEANLTFINNYMYGYSPKEYAYISHTGQKSNNYVREVYGSSYSVGDVVGIAIDLNNKKLEFYKNGVSQGIAYNNFNSISGDVVIGFREYYNIELLFNFGATPFQYPIPQGFLPYDIDNADWFVRFNNLIFLDGRYYAYINNEFIEVEPTKESFELYGTDLLDLVTTPTDIIMATMDEGDRVGEGKEFKKSFNMIDFKNKYGQIKAIKEM